MSRSKMCGRFGLTEPLQLQRGAGLFTVLHTDMVGDAVERLLVPRHNIAQSQLVIAIRTRPAHIGSSHLSDERHLDVLRWGLVPR